MKNAKEKQPWRLDAAGNPMARWDQFTNALKHLSAELAAWDRFLATDAGRKSFERGTRTIVRMLMSIQDASRSVSSMYSEYVPPSVGCGGECKCASRHADLLAVAKVIARQVSRGDAPIERGHDPWRANGSHHEHQQEFRL